MGELETSWWWSPERGEGRSVQGEVREPAAVGYGGPQEPFACEGDPALEVSAERLSDVELLSLLLADTVEGESGAEAKTLLARVGGLAQLGRADVRVLRFLSVSRPKRARLGAAVELAKRLARAEIPDRLPLDSPRTIAHYLALRYGASTQEVVGALFVDTKNRLIALRELFRGSTQRCAAEPAAFLREALLLGATGLVLFHNHPSGDPSPSPEDLQFTRRVREAAALLNIRLLDHIVVGSVGRWVSMQERGPWS